MVADERIIYISDDQCHVTRLTTCLENLEVLLFIRLFRFSFKLGFWLLLQYRYSPILNTLSIQDTMTVNLNDY